MSELEKRCRTEALRLAAEQKARGLAQGTIQLARFARESNGGGGGSRAESAGQGRRSKPRRVADNSTNGVRRIGGGGSRTRFRRDRELFDGARLLGPTRSLGGSCYRSLTSLTSSSNTRNRPGSWRDIGGGGTWTRPCPIPFPRACSRRLHSSVSDIALSRPGGPRWVTNRSFPVSARRRPGSRRRPGYGVPVR
jgi:hypothetical protein